MQIEIKLDESYDMPKLIVCYKNQTEIGDIDDEFRKESGLARPFGLSARRISRVYDYNCYLSDLTRAAIIHRQYRR